MLEHQHNNSTPSMVIENWWKKKILNVNEVWNMFSTIVMHTLTEAYRFHFDLWDHEECEKKSFDDKRDKIPFKLLSRDHNSSSLQVKHSSLLDRFE